MAADAIGAAGGEGAGAALVTGAASGVANIVVFSAGEGNSGGGGGTFSLRAMNSGRCGFALRSAGGGGSAPLSWAGSRVLTEGI